MSNNFVRFGKRAGAYIRNVNRRALALIKWSLLALGIACIFLSLPLIVGATPTSWAQCGSDSYVDCSGGVKCTATDQKGCACYNSNGSVAQKKSCKEAAPDEGFVMLEESDY